MPQSWFSRHTLAALALLAAIAGAAGCSDEALAPAGSDASADASLSQDGVDAASSCPPGLAGCVGDDRVVCNAAGSAFVVEACAEGLRCVDGACVACASDDDCDNARTCQQGACQVAPLAIETKALPPALVGVPYSFALQASGGVPPLTWSLDQGLLPDGVLLAPDGTIAGVAKATAKQSFSVKATDSAGATASGILVLEVKEGGLVIQTTSPLKKATEGKPYSVTFEASGGSKPYFFGLTAGKLPAGLGLTADGALAGTPTEDGAFSFDLKVLDNGAPAATATRSFELQVGLAPLEIVGSQQVNLFVTKIIVLPLIVVVDKVPVPYSAALQAQGGKKPYAWAEVPLPNAIKGFVPNSGLPKGLTLGKDGKISGAVSDASLVVKVQVPLTKISLEGFFFSAEVSDSQAKPEKKSAIFIIPTVPVAGL